MKPIGALMMEHRLIERMVSLMDEELRKIKGTNRVAPGFIEVATDFFRTYADRTHHGKEEDILFRDLARKGLSQEHRKTMEELIQEHVIARKAVGNLARAGESCAHGNTEALGQIVAHMAELVALYPRHIEKEDRHLFYPCMEYFSKEEQDKMLGEFWDFDREMIHEKYRMAVKELEKKG